MQERDMSRLESDHVPHYEIFVRVGDRGHVGSLCRVEVEGLEEARRVWDHLRTMPDARMASQRP